MLTLFLSQLSSSKRASLIMSNQPSQPRKAKHKRILIFIAAIFSVNLGCTVEKDRLDAKLRQLCAKDGGLKVYEKVELPPDMFDKFGVVTFPDATEKRPLGSDFILHEHTEYYRTGNPSLRRVHAKILRSADGRLLGEVTSYHRVGGDFPGPWHESSLACPHGVETATLKRSIFVIMKMRDKP